MAIWVRKFDDWIRRRNPQLLLRTRIGRRLLFIFLGVSLLPVIIVGWVSLRQGDREIHRETHAVLRAASDGAESELREFLDHLKTRAISISLDALIRDTAEEPSRQSSADLNRHLQQLASQFSESEELLALDRDGRVFGASNTNRIGRNLASDEFFRNGLERPYIGDVFRDRDGVLTWMISAPLISRANSNTVGVLAVRIRPEALSDLTTGLRITRMGADTQAFRIGGTGETYIVNRDKLMVTQSRYVTNAPLRVRVDTEPVRVAFTRNEEMTGDYSDYRGTSVSGASFLLQEPAWVVITEIDFREAYLPLLRLKNIVIFSGVGLGLIVFLLACAFTGKIIRPVEALNRADFALAEGKEFAAFVPASEMTDDEIGDAMRHRNEMVKSWFQQREALVREQANRAELLTQMLQEILHFSRTLFWRVTRQDLVEVPQNPWAKAEIFGSVEEVLGFPPAAFRKDADLWKAHIHPDDFQEIRRLLPRLRQPGSVVSWVYRWRHGNGNWMWIHEQVSLRQSPRDQNIILQGIGMEVTALMRVQQQLKEAQGELQHHAEELEKKVAERTASLTQTIHSLEGVCYHIAHDLRAPLRAMASFSSLLSQECGAEMSSLGQDYARRIHEASIKMDCLIHDLLEYGRLGHMDAPPEQASLGTVLHRALENLQPEIERTHASISVQQKLPIVWANEILLRQVLENLISNALKFVPRGVTPLVQIWAEPRGAKLRLWIQDNGIGIAAEYHDRIFRVFERLEVHDYPGTGIGLAIVAKAMQKMNGHAGLESEPGSGSRFWIELPAVELSPPKRKLTSIAIPAAFPGQS